MKKIKILFLIAMFMITTITLFGCNNNSNFNKSNWNEAYKIVYGIHSGSYGSDVDIDDYCLVTEDFYNQYVIEKYGQETIYTSWDFKLKKMYVKFENDICYIKLISWGNYEEIKTYERSKISWVDYI